MSHPRTLATALAVALLATGSADAQTRTLRFGNVQAVDHANNAGGRKAAEVMAQLSGGRLKLEIFPAAQLGKGQDMVQQVADGNLDFAIDGAALLAQWDKRLSVFEAPYLVRDFEHFRRMAASPFGDTVFRELREKRGIRTLDPWYFGTRQTTTRDRAINTVTDMKGLKLRVPEVPLYMDFARAVGAAPTPMAFAEVYLGLQTGTVQGQENPLPTINAAKFYEVQKFINLTSHIVLGLFPMMSEKTWGSLAPADREIVAKAFAEGGRVNDEMTMRDESRLLAFFKEKGLTVATPDLAPFRQAMAPVYAKYEEIWGKGVADALAAIK